MLPAPAKLFFTTEKKKDAYRERQPKPLLFFPVIHTYMRCDEVTETYCPITT